MELCAANMHKPAEWDRRCNHAEWNTGAPTDRHCNAHSAGAPVPIGLAAAPTLPPAAGRESMGTCAKELHSAEVKDLRRASFLEKVQMCYYRGTRIQRCTGP